MKSNNNILLAVATILMTVMMVVMFLQNNTLTKYRNLLEKTDTTTVQYSDTIYLNKTIIDSVPKYTTVTIFKRDTLYKKEGDSISATPTLITLKKKIIPTLY